MIDSVKDFLDEYNIKNTTVIIAFSSGPDSCALARIIIDIAEEYNLKVVLAYFNHMWRSEAIEEEKFTSDFAKKYNIEYIIGKAQGNIAHTEEVARDLRYEFLHNAANEYNSKTVFLAHNKNDNIETLLYRVIKGTSTKGLCSIPKTRDIFYRPLLNIEKKDILKYLDKINQKYLIDSSNADTKYKRNFIRNNIIPLLYEVNPNYMTGIQHLIDTSCHTTKILEDIINNILYKIKKDDTILRSKYLEYGVEYRYEILNSYLGNKLKYRDYKTIKKLDDFIVQNPHSKTSLNASEFLRTRKDKIYIEKRIDKNEPT